MLNRVGIMSSGVPPLLCEVARWIMLHGTVCAHSPRLRLCQVSGREFICGLC